MSAALSFEPDEPPGSGLPGAGWSQDEGAPQGLYVTWPAEELTLEGFAEDGRADTMAPGPLLAMILGAVAGQDGEGLAAGGDRRALNQSGLAKPGQHLGDGWPGDASPAGKLGGWDFVLTDRTHGEVLGHRQRRLMAGEQPFGPPASRGGSPRVRTRALDPAIAMLTGLVPAWDYRMERTGQC
jgi:hypothetical protein